MRLEVAQAPPTPVCHTNSHVFPLCTQNEKGLRRREVGRVGWGAVGEEGAGIWEVPRPPPHCFLTSSHHYSLPFWALPYAIFF